MKIFDCFIFFDEKDLVELRINILKDHVDYFVICEAEQNHRGLEKKLNFPIEKFNHIKEKIIYITFDKFPKLNSTWKRQDYQRNYLFNGLTKADANDLILFSDADEIPNPKVLKNLNKECYDRVGIFVQKFFYYKLNLNVASYPEWEGTRATIKNNIKSFSWMRDKVKLKNLKYKFWRIDKYKKVHKIDNGGWHFSFLGDPKFIASKIKSYTHNEFDKEEFTNLDKISQRIINLRDPFDREQELIKIEIDSTYPDYILNNKEKFKDWIL